MGRYGQVRLPEDGPEVASSGRTQPMRACPPLPLTFRQCGHRRRRRIGRQELPRQRARHLGDLERPRVVRLQRGGQLVDQAGLLADVPLTIFGEEFKLLGRFRARQQGAEVRMIRAQEVGQHSRVKRVTLGAALPKAIPGAVERLGIHGIDHHAMVEQKIHHPAVRPLDRGPEVDALRAPLVQALRRVRHRARGDLRPALIHNPDGMRLIRPIHSEVIAHSSSSFGALPSWPRSGNGEVGLIPALGGATFS